MKEKTKATMISRLEKVFDNSISQREICLSAIAICMLDAITTDEQLTRCSKTHQNQSGEQEVQDQFSSPKPEENSID